MVDSFEYWCETPHATNGDQSKKKKMWQLCQFWSKFHLHMCFQYNTFHRLICWMYSENDSTLSKFDVRTDFRRALDHVSQYITTRQNIQHFNMIALISYSTIKVTVRHLTVMRLCMWMRNVRPQLSWNNRSYLWDIWPKAWIFWIFMP